MNSRKIAGLICSSALVLAGSAGLGQQETTPAASPQSRPGAFKQSPTSTSRMQSGHPVRASQVIGSTVKSSEGKTLGQVRDIVIDPQWGRIDFAVVAPSASADPSATAAKPSTSATSPATTTPSATSYSAATGLKLVPVPWQLFNQNFTAMSPAPGATTSVLGTGTMGGTMTLTLNIDEAKFRGAPSFDANNWNTIQGSDFGQRSYAYYGLDWNSRRSGAGTPGAGVSTGIGTSSSERPEPRPKLETDSPDRTKTVPPKTTPN